MTYFPPGGGVQFPRKLPPPREDRNDWRQDDGKRRRIISPFRFFMLIVLLAIAASVAALCLTSSDSNSLDVELISPEDGSVHPPGTVIVRFRAVGGDVALHWALSYRHLAEEDAWTELGDGTGDVIPRARSTNEGLFLLELSATGNYEVRLIVSHGPDNEQVIESAEFAIEP